LASPTEIAHPGERDPSGDSALFRAMFEHAGVGIARVAPGGHFLQVNRRFLDIVGYTEAELAGLTFRDITPPEDLEFDQAQVDRLVAGEISMIQREKRYRRRDGGEVWARLSVSAERGPDGRAQSMVAVVVDETDRHAMEEALRRREAQLTEAQRIAQVGSWEHRMGSGELTCSPEAARILGLDSLTRVPLERVLDHVHADDRADLLRAAEQVRALDPAFGGELVAECRVVHPDGSTRAVECRCRMTGGPDAGPPALLGTVRDITPQRSAAESQRLQEAFLRAVIDANPNPVFAKDRDGRFTVANQAIAEIYGTTPEQMLGRTDADFNRNPDEVAAYLAADRDVIDTGVPRLIQEEALTDPATGAIRWLQTRKVRFVPPGGGAAQVLGVAVDITERRALEQQLRQAQKMEAIGRLAGGIAHDFNNLLTVIGGHTQLLLMDAPEEDPQREDLLEIQDGVERAAALTRQLLAFSRKQILQPRVISLNDLVAGTERMLRRLIGEDVELISHLDPALGPVLADPGQLEQVLMNLAVNARDAMPQGGKLIVETHNAVMGQSGAHLHPYLHEDTPAILLTVSDTGVGMPREVQAHIFEPFFTTKGQGKGTGLGLATVYGIVKQSGGYIWVYSEEGRGTTFKIYLPRAELAGEALPDSAEAGESGVPRTGTILLVEDDAGVREVATQSLERGGHTVFAVGSPEEALLACSEHRDRIDLLITDVIMPGMNGRELAERIQRLQPRLRVLYMSGYTDEAIVHHGVLDPGTEFIPKPFGPANLNRRVARLLAAGDR
jgi:two-component system, cell cycle sensor histidine kinase and response regulator CckA